VGAFVWMQFFPTQIAPEDMSPYKLIHIDDLVLKTYQLFFSDTLMHV
jgi:hypothetical protein